MSRHGDRYSTYSNRLPLLLVVAACLLGCSADDSISLEQCTTSSDCPRPFFCNFGQCAPLDSVDRDGDGIPEEVERSLGLDAERTDSDGDGQSDFNELEFDSDTREFTPRDRDGDGIIDALESDTEDADGDGYSDEVDPCNLDPDCPTEGGQENDCAYQVGEICVYGLGACEVLGNLECAAGRRDAVCVAEEVPPQVERCDEIDNDCDGKTDEDFGDVGSICTPGVGLCRATGVIQCDSDTSSSCSVEAGTPSEELCDGNDNDCDGRIDEDYELGASCDSGEGRCFREGIVGCDENQVNARCLPMMVDDVPEVCDAVDNDCDGLIDEDFDAIGAACEQGEGACTVQGVLACNLEGTALVCSVVATDSTPELCNDLDDDCDGQVDESFAQKGAQCSGGIGACVFDGHYICDVAGTEVTCDAQMPSTVEERCDFVDNDCDGRVDETFLELGNACTVGVGACERAGEVVCDSISGLSRCDARAGFSSIERCNGFDDDCDGSTDETFPGVGEDCEVTEGNCRFTGTQQCNLSSILSCIPMTPIQGDELCDNLDNDCDGQVDETLGVGEACLLNSGGCERMGTQTCASDGTVYCSASPLPQVAERCDTLDNDCDGRVDEDFQRLNEICDVALGVCRGTGRYQCANNETELVCDAVPSATPNDERCDGLDNDCDGFSDETFPNLNNICFSGDFTCAVEGRLVCDVREAQLICDAVARTPSIERCNDFDDDCNGQIDEDFSDKNQPCTTGLGTCQTQGQWRCSADEIELVCLSDTIISPTTERCDDLDNDCDGAVDEDYGPGCRLLVESVSTGGFHTCFQTPSNEVRCFGDEPGSTPAHSAIQLDGSGDDHCLITIEDALHCWGTSASLTSVPAGRYSDLSVGRSADACAIEATTDIAVCWGDTAALLTTPQTPLSHIEVAEDWACGLARDTAQVQCWGNVPNGTLVPSGPGFTQLSMGGQLACAINAERNLQCWGIDAYDMLDPPTGVFEHLSIGPNSGCAIAPNGVPTCWGLGSPTRPHFGQGIPPSDITFQSVSVGAYHTCGRRVDGTMSCWGAGSPGGQAGPFNAGQASPP
jgi:hypothetical protein